MKLEGMLHRLTMGFHLKYILNSKHCPKLPRLSHGTLQWLVHSFFAGRGPAYSGPQHWDHIAVHCTCPGRGRELVGVCYVC